MSLDMSAEEAFAILEDIENYPEGIHRDSWGYGPLEFQEYLQDFSREEQEEYG